MKRTSISNAKIGGTNFSGLDFTGYNVKNVRSFMMFIDDPELLERWRKDGVKIYEGKKGRCFTCICLPDDDKICRIQTRFRGEEPKILHSLSYSLLDVCKISRADLIINEYHWSIHDRSGVKLYLTGGTFTINKRVNASNVFEFFGRREKAIGNYGTFVIKEANNG